MIQNPAFTMTVKTCGLPFNLIYFKMKRRSKVELRKRRSKGFLNKILGENRKLRSAVHRIKLEVMLQAYCNVMSFVLHSPQFIAKCIFQFFSFRRTRLKTGRRIHF